MPNWGAGLRFRGHLFPRIMQIVVWGLSSGDIIVWVLAPAWSSFSFLDTTDQPGCDGPWLRFEEYSTVVVLTSSPTFYACIHGHGTSVYTGEASHWEGDASSSIRYSFSHQHSRGDTKFIFQSLILLIECYLCFVHVTFGSFRSWYMVVL
jgi:hypothetical protein